MKILVLLLILTLPLATPVYSTEHTSSGTILAPGDQTFIKGWAVSCQAPLPTEGKYTLQLSLTYKDANGKYVAEDKEFTFTFKAVASAKELRKKADEIILEYNIDPNSIFESNLFGPN